MNKSSGPFPMAIVLSESQWEHFMETMSNPPPPTEELRKGAELLDSLRKHQEKQIERTNKLTPLLPKK